MRPRVLSKDSWILDLQCRIWGLATAARLNALRDLTWEQIDWENALINLNSAGRTQTTKRRPVVKLPPFLAELYGAAHFSGAIGPIATYDGRPVKSVRTAWRKARAKAGLDKDVQPYSLRHTAARWLRKDGVPIWEVAAQLGHSTARHEMTERYAAFSPDYLEKSATSLDRLRNEVRDTCPPQIWGGSAKNPVGKGI